MGSTDVGLKQMIIFYGHLIRMENNRISKAEFPKAVRRKKEESQEETD